MDTIRDCAPCMVCSSRRDPQFRQGVTVPAFRERAPLRNDGESAGADARNERWTGGRDEGLCENDFEVVTAQIKPVTTSEVVFAGAADPFAR